MRCKIDLMRVSVCGGTENHLTCALKCPFNRHFELNPLLMKCLEICGNAKPHAVVQIATQTVPAI
jgi:hypothetical protein